MRRSIALILILALLAAVGVTAFATETTETSGGNSQEVLASYEEGNQDKTVISVDISWEQMSFTYRGESAPAWNAEEHRYEGEATEAGWAPGTGLITIRNNSNTILQAHVGYQQETAYETVEMSFTDEAPYIGSAYTDDRKDAEGNVCGTPCEVILKAIPTGTLSEDTVDNTRIGTITITLSAEVDVYEMLDNLTVRIAECDIQDITGLARGTAFLVSGTDADAIQQLVVDALEAYASDQDVPQKNVAINKALTAFYGALDITQ